MINKAERPIGDGDLNGTPSSPKNKLWCFLRGTRVKTPTVLQMEANECGAAALGIVLAYYGRWVSLEELRLSCGVSRDGSKASNILRAARGYGLIGKGLTTEPEKLPLLPLPMIVHWEFRHFVVVEGFRKRRVYLNDPARGPKAISVEEFDRSFTGVVLIFKPGPDFQLSGEKTRLAPALRRRLSGSKLRLAYVMFLSLLLIIPGLLGPVFLKIFVDDYLVRGARSWINLLLAGMALTAIVQGTLVWFQQSALLRLQTKMAVNESGKFLWHVLHLPHEFYMQRYAGDIASRVAINDQLARLLTGDLATTMLSIIVIVFYAIFMVQYDVTLTAIGILIAALNFVALRYVSRRRIDVYHKLLQERGKFMGICMVGIRRIETLKAAGQESDFFSRWAGQYTAQLNAQQELAVPTLLLSALPLLLAGISTAAILAIGGLHVMDGLLTLGMLVAFQSLMASFSRPVNQLVSVGSQLQEVEGDVSRLDDVLRYKTDRQLLEQRMVEGSSNRVGKLSGRVELRNVTFGYSRLEPPLIERFNLILNPGDRVALVGATGSGKSTIAKLVSGLYEPWEGQILFDGQPRDRIPLGVMSESMALVDQDIFLFSDTVRQNLTLWDPTVPEVNIVRAASDACLDDNVVARPDGLDSLIEEGGLNISGGERQRLEIARALVRNPTVLVLDEATSALDPLTEQQVAHNLRRRGCTCLIIAHRLSTIRDCDEIIVLDQGKVIQRGTHDLLCSVDGPYTRLNGSEEIEAETYESDSWESRC